MAVAAGAAVAGVTGVTAGAHNDGKSDLLRDHDALGLADLIKSKAVSPSELLELAITRAEDVNRRRIRTPDRRPKGTPL
jgi:hypothetical protein